MTSYKYKLRPSAGIIAVFEAWLAICCELYNAALAERRDAYRIAHKSMGYRAQSAQLPGVKAEREDVARVHSQILQNALKRVDRAFEDFFRRVRRGQRPGYPRFRSRYRYDSFTFPQAKGAFRLEGKKLWLSKIGKVKVHVSRPIEGRIKTCTIKREVDGWYAIFTVEELAAEPLPASGESVGTDLGIENFATLSTGEVIGNPEDLRAAEARLKTVQRKVSRRKRGSRRRKKAIRLLAKLHSKIKRQRADFHHKTARRIVSEYGVIAVEDLNVQAMVKNHHLAKSISDAGWNLFILILSDKARKLGRELIKVNPSFTSQDCSRCGERVRKTLAMREHRCITCGLVIHRDYNAALNIKGRAAPSGMVPIGEPCEPRTYRPTEPESSSGSH